MHIVAWAIVAGLIAGYWLGWATDDSGGWPE
jgi:hypothetical protein